ncbi:MAG TPA: hypothetical protein PLX73_02245 [Candidatus Paceibacterota bacterium]|nr:hypothetical protein [Candidatus Paceibacterota bacterium]HPP17179.1 hypothetical protein [Candidatus Paceibacterota bacterium]
MPDIIPQSKPDNNPYTQPSWDILLQRDLIRESGIDKLEWIQLYSPKFRDLVEEKAEIIKTLQNDPEKLKEQFKKWLYESRNETIH